jgi:hypothetical protein
MSVNLITRVFGWWLSGERVCRRLTLPRADLAKSDEAVERLIIDSAVWSTAAHFVRRSTVAWSESRLQSRIQRLVNRWAFRRQAGWTMTIAALTVFVAQWLAAAHIEPLAWIEPSFMAVLGLACWFSSFVVRPSGETDR